MQALSVILKEKPHELVVKLVLNRPEAANAINTDLAKKLAEAFENTENARVVLLTGSGNRAFCAGADLKEREGMDQTLWELQHQAFESALKAVMGCKIPVIAVANGAAYAGGLELALACDFIIASDNARFALTEASLGIMPGLGGTQSLPRAIGARAAKEMLFTAKPIDAEKALSLGLVNAVFTQNNLQNEALKLAEAIAENAPLSLKGIKKAMREGENLPIEKSLEKELEIYKTLINTKDRVEGNSAFLEKRKPNFTGN